MKVHPLSHPYRFVRHETLKSSCLMHLSASQTGIWAHQDFHGMAFSLRIAELEFVLSISACRTIPNATYLRTREPSHRAIHSEACLPCFPLTQVPLVNGSKENWLVRVECKGEQFTGPRELSVLAGLTGMYPLHFYPPSMGFFAGSVEFAIAAIGRCHPFHKVQSLSDERLLIVFCCNARPSNARSNGRNPCKIDPCSDALAYAAADFTWTAGEKHVFSVTGRGLEPFAEERISLECVARTTLTRTILVPTLAPGHSSSYAVMADACMISGAPRLTVPSAGRAGYIVSIHPHAVGDFLSSIVFLADSGEPVMCHVYMAEVVLYALMGCARLSYCQACFCMC